MRKTLAVLLCAFWAAAPAADYPDRPVRIITQGAAGSGPDVIARITAEHLARPWGRAPVIVNQPGGGGMVAARAAASAEPDGYTLFFPTITTLVILPEMHEKLPFDLERQFVHIGLVAETPMVIATAAALGVNSLSELIAHAKAQPGALFYAANNRGSLPHLTGELLRTRAGIELSFIPYPGVAAGLQDLLGGRVGMIVESLGALSGALKGGGVKPLAVTSPKRLAQLPDTPTVAETAPGFTAVAWFALSAPAGMPPAIVDKVNRDLNSALQSPALRSRFEELGAFVRPMSPRETAEFVRAEQEAWRPVIRQVGLKAQ